MLSLIGVHFLWPFWNLINGRDDWNEKQILWRNAEPTTTHKKKREKQKKRVKWSTPLKYFNGEANGNETTNGKLL